MRARSGTLGFVVLMLFMASVGAQPPWPGDIAGERSAQGRQIGVLVEEIPLDRLDALGLPYGVRITRVFPGSPAQAAGLRPDDIVLEAAGQPVFSVPRLRWLVGKSAPRDSLDITYYRDGAQASAEIRPGPLRPAVPPASEWRGERAWTSPSYLGVGLQPLTPGLREAFSVPSGVGVLISEVYPDTPASKSGLSAGDVVVRMDRRTIGEIADIHRVLDYFEPGEQLVVEVIRDGKNQELTVTLGQRDRPPRREPGPGGVEPRGDTQPLFDPAWWDEIEEFVDRWKDYFEQRHAERPPVAL
ncbi:MAG: PDZ domain-containing protein [Gammaproteobacteria bacterium]|jgi:membrane-associated protease RseP (regulator of RpoE activity)|nr:MAG: PDZ domain-containing protein [Gammaproteobacteria bacterium]